MGFDTTTKLTGSEVLEILRDILADVESKAMEQLHFASRDMSIAYSTQISLCEVIKVLLSDKVH